mmetsp:Transcript_3343/g.10426  ORF Transcript_3343/g.10426 Transcript_3343/m.10426 type:complete len:217 (-) Transcript_3343:675-1325(-)
MLSRKYLISSAVGTSCAAGVSQRSTICASRRLASRAVCGARGARIWRKPSFGHSARREDITPRITTEAAAAVAMRVSVSPRGWPNREVNSMREASPSSAAPSLSALDAHARSSVDSALTKSRVFSKRNSNTRSGSSLDASNASSGFTSDAPLSSRLLLRILPSAWNTDSVSLRPAPADNHRRRRFIAAPSSPTANVRRLRFRTPTGRANIVVSALR